MTRLERALLLALCGLALGAIAPAAPAKIAGAPLVYMRSGPGASHQPIAVLSDGEAVTTVESVGSWTKIRTQAGEIGFVYGSFVHEASAEEGEAPPPQESAPEPEAMGIFPSTDPQELSSEVAQLRSEIDNLKDELRQRLESESPTASQGHEGGFPNGLEAEADVQIIAVALVSLVIGWIFGVVFSRRRNRVQRGRLRF